MDFVRYKLVIVCLCQKQYVVDYFGYLVIFFKIGVEDIFKFFLGLILIQCDFSLCYQIGDGCFDFMCDIGREIGLVGKDVFNFFNYMIE